MSEDLEKNLRRALRPVDPGDEFTRRVMEGIDGEAARRGPGTDARGRGPRDGVGSWRRDGLGALRRRGPTAAVALAASVVLVVVGVLAWKQRHEAEGLAARAQVIEALRVTSDKLDLAYRLVNTPPQSSRGDEPGA